MELSVDGRREDRHEMIRRGQKVSLSCLSYAASKLRKMYDTDFTTRLNEGGGSFLLTIGSAKQAVFVVDVVREEGTPGLFTQSQPD
jgi:hypothetical protein